MAKQKVKAKQVRKSNPPTTVQVPEAGTDMVLRPDHPIKIIQGVASDPRVDVSKLRELIELQKDMMRTQAKIEFDQAFAEMHPELPVIHKRGVITGRAEKNNPNSARVTRSKYARLGEDIQPAVNPVLKRYGFSIRFRTDWPREDMVRVTGILSHRGGHSEESHFEGPADKSDYRTHVQSLGSTVSYGRRYTTIDLLNLTIIGGADGTDNDGQTSPKSVADRPAVNPRGDEPITAPQVGRLNRIANEAGRGAREVDMWLAAEWNYQTREAIRRKDYDAICAAIEHPGPLRPTE